MPILSQFSIQFKTARIRITGILFTHLFRHKSVLKSHHNPHTDCSICGLQSTFSRLLSFSTRGGLNQDGHRVQKHDLLTRWPPLITIDSLLQDGRHWAHVLSCKMAAIEHIFSPSRWPPLSTCSLLQDGRNWTHELSYKMTATSHGIAARWPSS